MTIQLTAFLVSFIAIFLRGFQQKNVIHSKYTMIAITSYLLALTDVAVVSIIVEHGWNTVLAQGTGAALGMLASVYIHNRWVK
jgi:hypothetical protein